LEKLWVGVTAFGKIWVSIVTTFGNSPGYYCNGVWKNYGLL